MPSRLTTVANAIVALASLTEREKDVLSLLLRGKTNIEVGQSLDLSDRTVEVHRRRVLKKMKAGSSLELGYLVGLVMGSGSPSPLQGRDRR